MIRSFKLKMALFAAGTSGAIFLAFALLFLSTIRRAGLERIDRHLYAVTEAQLRRPPSPEFWPRFDASLAAMYGAARPRQFLVRVLGRDGETLYRSPRWPDALDPDAFGTAAYVARRAGTLPGPPPQGRPFHPLRPGPGGEPPPGRFALKPPLFHTAPAGGTTWRVLLLGTDALTLLVATDLADFHAEVNRHWRTFALASPLVLLLLASGGWLLAGQALRPVRTLTQVAAGITARGLDRRVQTPGADREFQALTEVLNDMLDRLEKSFRQAARFSADAAHELKTPLTILQGQLEQAVQRAPADSAEQRACAGLLEEVQRLKGIVRKLLLLAQSDAGQLRLTLEPVDLSGELDALFEDLPVLAPGVRLSRDVEPGVRVNADPDLLRNVLHNLFSNAVKYNARDGAIACALRRAGGAAELSLTNRTDPEAAFDAERLFERFYRGDPARARQVDGTGLGLSLAREIARAHGGDLTAHADAPGAVTFRLTWPAA